MKIYQIKMVRRGVERLIEGDLDTLTKYFKYTLEVGASYSMEVGNCKINTKPKNIGSLLKNLNNAASNAACDGGSSVYYELV